MGSCFAGVLSTVVRGAGRDVKPDGTRRCRTFSARRSGAAGSTRNSRADGKGKNPKIFHSDGPRAAWPRLIVAVVILGPAVSAVVVGASLMAAVVVRASLMAAVLVRRCVTVGVVDLECVLVVAGIVVCVFLCRGRSPGISARPARGNGGEQLGRKGARNSARTNGRA